ncbi:hypothetical protein AMJ44_10485 [candidate division WOR-1 bacterium DG_54_3]|uniref:Uncharacterized protein n=1 Tax=candidate division WOR-1 bacterium DG_54_3 TaxID=1703775 RepID=A0A0S7XTB4_UNCSA|nr:MAG: hypothetical protein AMJ44_10485 [candidate division WOR-1 bacterium DG_54_3]
MYKRLGITIAILNTLAAVNSTNFFLNLAKASFTEWIFFNACAPSIALFLLGYVLRNRIIQSMSIPALAFFGGGGLFVFGWTGGALIAQTGHIFMVSAILWIVCGIFRDKTFKEATIGLLLAAVFVSAFITVQQKYAYNNWMRLEQIMSYDPSSQISYVGILPCADCSGLKTELTLYANGTYFLRETYLATRYGDRAYNSFGKYKRIKNRGREIVQLNYNKPEEIYNFIAPDDDHLRVLDKEFNEIDTPMNMKLTRKK